MEQKNKHPFNDGFKDNNEEENEGESQSGLSEKDFEDKNPKEFSVRINNETQMVELLSNNDGRVLETMAPEGLMGIISKLDNASGILVNRRI